MACTANRVNGDLMGEEEVEQEMNTRFTGGTRANQYQDQDIARSTGGGNYVHFQGVLFFFYTAWACGTAGL